MLSPIGGIQQQFSGGSWCLLVCRVQQEFTDRAPQGSASGLTGADHSSAPRHQTAVGQPLDQMLDLRGLAAAVDALQNNEATCHGKRRARALSTTVIELRAINSAANGGDSSTPWLGSKAPAATGRTIRL